MALSNSRSLAFLMKNTLMPALLMVNLAGSRCAIVAGEQQQAADKHYNFAKKSVENMVLYRGEDQTTRLQLHPQPVKQISNATTKSTGSVFVWTAGGRPEAVVEVFYHRTELYFHNFQSLSSEPLFAERDGKPIWTPSQAGLQMNPVEGAPSPAEKAFQRLRQMKMIARRFTGEVIVPASGRNELRLLPTPLFRYKSPQPPVMDGALFVLALGTGSEVALLIEARSNEGEQPSWHYGLARMNPFETTVFEKGEKIWHVPRLAESPASRFKSRGTFYTWKLAPE